MATNDKNDLLIKISTHINDNTEGEISPSDLRTVLSAMVTADLNLSESTVQEILGDVNFNSSATKSGVEIATVDMIADAIPTSYCDYSAAQNPPISLTTTPQIITGWSELIAPIGISESAGVFTIVNPGVYNFGLERVYENDDANPTDQVFVTITVEADIGAGYESIFTRTVPMSSATARDEPAILSFTTLGNRALPSGSTLRVLVSGVDGAANPQDTKLIGAAVTANLIHNLP